MKTISIDGVKLADLDCGDGGCRFVKVKSGQRTNGGCRCLEGLPLDLQIAIIKLYNIK